MDMEELKTEEYCVTYDPTSTTVSFQGELSLPGPTAYGPIIKLLQDIADQEPSTITLNFCQLEFLNSSGISMISKFVINMRKKKMTKVVVIGSKNIYWQGKTLPNLEKLFPGLQLEIA